MRYLCLIYLDEKELDAPPISSAIQGASVRPYKELDEIRASPSSRSQLLQHLLLRGRAFAWCELADVMPAGELAKLFTAQISGRPDEKRYFVTNHSSRGSR